MADGEEERGGAVRWRASIGRIVTPVYSANCGTAGLRKYARVRVSSHTNRGDAAGQNSCGGSEDPDSTSKKGEINIECSK